MILLIQSLLSRKILINRCRNTYTKHVVTPFMETYQFCARPNHYKINQLVDLCFYLDLDLRDNCINETRCSINAHCEVVNFMDLTLGCVCEQGFTGDGLECTSMSN